MEAIREITTEKDMTCMKGMKIRKGTRLFVMKEGAVHPTLKHRVLVVRVDNGTGHLDLCPETAIREEAN